MKGWINREYKLHRADKSCPLEEARETETDRQLARQTDRQTDRQRGVSSNLTVIDKLEIRCMQIVY